MNKTIIAITESKNATAKKFAEVLSLNRNHRINLNFKKKDGSIRNMTIVPQSEWNQMIGKATTSVGHKIVSTKVNNDMATVVELTNDGIFQPRTINCATVIDYKILSR